MYTLAKIGGPDGPTVTPYMVAANEKFLDTHELTFSVDQSYAQILEVGTPILFTWFPDIEFIITSIGINNNTCDLKCLSTESILKNRPAVPDVRSLEWRDAEWPDGWYFGDELNDVARIPIRDVLDTVWDRSTKWYQESGYNTGPVDLVSQLGYDFSRGITGNLGYYPVDGSLFETIQDLIGMSTTRARLRTARRDSAEDYTIRFYTEPCRDRVRSIRIENFRSEVKNIRTNIEINDRTNLIIRSNEDVVAISELYKPARNYVTMSLVESADFDMGGLELSKSRLNDLVYEPYSTMSEGYTVEFEFHGELDLSGIHPGDTVTIDSNHPRPSWIPEELMISEIVRTFDHLGYREYPLLTTVPAVYGRDNVVTNYIKNNIREFNAN